MSTCQVFIVDKKVSDHPEAVCERCGGLNPIWYVDSDRFITAVNRSEIICPTCFIIAHEAATGMTTLWGLEPHSPFRWIEDEGKETPLIKGDNE